MFRKKGKERDSKRRSVKQDTCRSFWSAGGGRLNPIQRMQGHLWVALGERLGRAPHRNAVARANPRRLGIQDNFGFDTNVICGVN